MKKDELPTLMRLKKKSKKKDDVQTLKIVNKKDFEYIDEVVDIKDESWCPNCQVTTKLMKIREADGWLYYYHCQICGGVKPFYKKPFLPAKT